MYYHDMSKVNKLFLINQTFWQLKSDLTRWNRTTARERGATLYLSPPTSEMDV